MIHNPVSYNTRSKNGQLLKPLERSSIIRNLWICPSHLYPYFKNDTWSVWFKDHIKHTKSPSSFLAEKGHEFEKKIVDCLKKNYDYIEFSSKYNEKNVPKTIKAINDSIPLIFSASINNPKNNTYGVIDILMRNDIFKKIFKEDLTLPNSPDVFYVVIDVKYKKLYLNSTRTAIKNKTPSTLANKAQLYIYNEALARIQNFNLDKAYFIGSSYEYKQDDTIIIKNPFEMIAPVDFISESDISIKTYDAMNWYKQYKTYGKHWTYNPPTNDYMNINMTVDSGVYNYFKKQIAEKMGEISLLYNCGKRERVRANEHNLFSWKDPSWNTGCLRINSKQKECIVNRMIKINTQHKQNIIPERLSPSLTTILNIDSENFYVDFETLNTICDVEKKNIPHQHYIFMIGVTHKQNRRWVHKTFCIENVTLLEEYRIMNEFICYMYKHSPNPQVVYWHAEKMFWDKAVDNVFERVTTSMQKDIIIDTWVINHWVDLASLLRKEGLVIRGVYSYKLKEVAYKLAEYGYISLKKNNSSCMDGINAMFLAYNHFTTNSRKNVLSQIKKYNKIDCKMLYSIWEFFKKY